MDFKRMINAATEKISGLFGVQKKSSDTTTMAVTIGLVVGLVLLGGFYSYRWYRAGQEEVAQRMFSQNVQEYERVMHEGKNEDWASLETLFKLGYNQYSHSVLAPFFLIYQAQAMIKQDKSQEAREVLAKAVDAMSSSSPLYPLFKIKLALITMDTNAQEAVAQLQALANDTASHFNDAAAYYLGEYYWLNNEDAKAKEVWQKMIDATKTDKKLGQSPWASMAQEKLAQRA